MNVPLENTGVIFIANLSHDAKVAVLQLNHKLCEYGLLHTGVHLFKGLIQKRPHHDWWQRVRKLKKNV
jgi:hypothetical protein